MDPLQVTINNIKKNHPEFYEATKDLIVFEHKVKELIEDRYGKDTLDSIMMLHEYNKEYENVTNGILKNTNFSRLAQRKKELFDKYSMVTFRLAQQIGMKDAMAYMDILDTYLKSAIKILL